MLKLPLRFFLAVNLLSWILSFFLIIGEWMTPLCGQQLQNVTIYKIYAVTYQCQCLMTCVNIGPLVVFVFLSGNAK